LNDWLGCERSGDVWQHWDGRYPSGLKGLNSRPTGEIG
jgi:hypothetical protein